MKYWWLLCILGVGLLISPYVFGRTSQFAVIQSGIPFVEGWENGASNWIVTPYGNGSGGSDITTAWAIEGTHSLNFSGNTAIQATVNNPYRTNTVYVYGTFYFPYLPPVNFANAFGIGMFELRCGARGNPEYSAVPLIVMQVLSMDGCRTFPLRMLLSTTATT